MRRQHPFLIKKKNHLVAPRVLTNNALSFSVDNSLACHVRYIWTDLALEGFAILDDQVMGGRYVFWSRPGAGAVTPINPSMIGL